MHNGQHKLIQSKITIIRTYENSVGDINRSRLSYTECVMYFELKKSHCFSSSEFDTDVSPYIESFRVIRVRRLGCLLLRRKEGAREKEWKEGMIKLQNTEIYLGQSGTKV